MSRRRPARLTLAVVALVLVTRPAAAQRVEDDVPDLLAYVPAETAFTAVVEVKALLAEPSQADAAAALTAPEVRKDVRDAFGVEPDQIERIAAYRPRPAGGAALTPERAGAALEGPATLLIRTVDPLAPLPEGAGGGLVDRLDARTLRIRRPADPDAGPARPARSAETLPAFASFRRRPGRPALPAALMTVDLTVLRAATAETMDRALLRAERDPGEAALLVTMLRPALVHADRLAVGLRFGAGGDGPGGKLTLTAMTSSPTAEAAAKVEATAVAVLTLARNAADAVAAALRGQPLAPEKVAPVLAVARAMLDSAKVVRDGGRTTLTLSAGEPAPSLFSLLLPPALRGRANAARIAAKVKLRQVGLAMANYEATHRHFPPAVVVENGVKRSWRVELLPFLDEDELHARYDKTKPWDDPANAAVLAQMPDVYRSPFDGRGGSLTSYLAVIGREKQSEPDNFGQQRTVGATFWRAEGDADDRSAGTRIREVEDNTGSTIMIVEAKRDVPWTKPEDIVVDVTEPVPPATFGGFDPAGFVAALVDGSVGFVPAATDATTLQALLTRDGEEKVNNRFLHEDR